MGVRNSPVQLLLKITSPGVADFYQSSELWDLNLPDPDNRRPVDFESRRLSPKSCANTPARTAHPFSPASSKIGTMVQLNSAFFQRFWPSVAIILLFHNGADEPP